jgi:CBS domain-containing protein
MRNWTVDDVMTKAVVTVDEAASYRSVVDLLIERRFSAVPVVDAFQRVTGVVSETDLIRKIEYAGDETPRLFESRHRRGERGKALARTAADLMSEPAVTVLTGTSIAAAARKMDDRNVKRLPVTDDLGRLVGIVTRGDLLKVHLRPDDDIRSDVETSALAGLTGKVTAEVAIGAVTLDGRVSQASIAQQIVRQTRRVPGVVDVIDKITFDYDDVNAPGIAYGIA